MRRRLPVVRDLVGGGQSRSHASRRACRVAQYRPHLDRWASEVNNRRELTLLVYVNVGWDAAKNGGHLRLHPDPNNPGENTVDIDPIAGRIVIFESGKQMHEVMESRLGADRLAITMWVEYAADWQEPEKAMLPALK